MLELAIVLLLIVVNGFFALSEMALMTSRKLRLRQMAETSRGARKALVLTDHPDRLLSTVQVGITAISVMTGYFGGESIGLLIAGGLENLVPAAREYTRTIGIGTAMVLITAASVIFGELIPKRLALTNPERLAAFVAIPLDALSRLARPIVMVLGAINRGVLRLLGIKDDARSAISEEEIRMLVTESHEQGVIDADERKMMNRVLSLGDRTAESLMTPRMRIAWLDAAGTLEENLAAMREHAYSRYPVYRGGDNDVLGMLEVKTLLDNLGHPDPDLFGELREPLFVSESTHALKLLEIFREEQQSIALVVDEYGDVSGLVTVNDLMGAVIGRIHGAALSGEDDAHEPPVVEREDGSWFVDGALPLEELREPLFVSESTHALKLLEIFREEQQSIALVVDEYGDVSGLVTVNDLMGAVIGRIHGAPLSGEDDAHEPPVVEREDGSWFVDGALPLEELRELIGGSSLPGEQEHDFHTAAGMVIAHFGRIPHVGENFGWDGWRIEVVDLDGPRIDKLLLQREMRDEDSEDDDTTG